MDAQQHIAELEVELVASRARIAEQDARIAELTKRVEVLLEMRLAVGHAMSTVEKGCQRLLDRRTGELETSAVRRAEGTEVAG